MSQRQMLGLERDNKKRERTEERAIPHRGRFELLMSFGFGKEEGKGKGRKNQDLGPIKVLKSDKNF